MLSSLPVETQIIQIVVFAREIREKTELEIAGVFRYLIMFNADEYL